MSWRKCAYFPQIRTEDFLHTAVKWRLLNVLPSITKMKD